MDVQVREILRHRLSPATEGGLLVVGWSRRRGRPSLRPRQRLDLSGGNQMAADRPDPGEFLELAQRMLREMFGGPRSDEEPWADATRRPGERPAIPQGNRGLS